MKLYFLYDNVSKRVCSIFASENEAVATRQALSFSTSTRIDPGALTLYHVADIESMERIGSDNLYPVNPKQCFYYDLILGREIETDIADLDVPYLTKEEQKRYNDLKELSRRPSYGQDKKL